MSLLDTTQLSLEAAMRGSMTRQSLLTNNLANADTPGYQREDVNFQGTLQSALAAGSSPTSVNFTPTTQPGSVSADKMRALLESTTGDHDLDPATSTATLTSADGSCTLTISANGDGSNNSAFDQDFFKMTFTGPAGACVRKLSLDASSAGEVFDDSPDNGYPFTVGDTINVAKTAVTAALTTGASGDASTKLGLIFDAGAFETGGAFDFGIDRDTIQDHSGGNSADLLANTKVLARFLLPDGSKEKVTGTLVNQTGHGYSPDVGYGLINAKAALQALLGSQ